MIMTKGCELPLKTAERLVRIPQHLWHEGLCEIRLRAGRRAYAITAAGHNIPCSDKLSPADLECCFQEICRYSVHSFAREISEGYITLEGGHRAGFCGSAVLKDGQVFAVKDISSINIRLAREVTGCAAELHRRVFHDASRSLLLCGVPLSGKTTILRDLARILGETHRVALIDSRNELAAAFGGVPMLNVGENTDVLSGYPRYEGIMTALRVLSPEYIICDEIGSDCDAVKKCIDCGVKLIAAAHANSFEGAFFQPQLKDIIPRFDAVAVLSGLGRVSEIRFGKGEVLCGC